MNGQNTLVIYPKYTLSTDGLELLKQMFLQSIAFIKRLPKYGEMKVIDFCEKTKSAFF